MKGYKLTTEQKDSIQKVEFADAQAFNCVQDINDEWFTLITEQQIEFIKGTQFAWILNCEQGEYVPQIHYTNIDFKIFYFEEDWVYLETKEGKLSEVLKYIYSLPKKKYGIEIETMFNKQIITFE